MTLKRSRSRNSTAAQQSRVVALGAPDRLVEAVDEQHAVRQAGERVVERVVLEAALGLAAVGDVGDRADDARGAAAVVAHGGRAGEHPAVAAVAVLHAMLELEVVAAVPGRNASSACVSGARSSAWTRPSHSPRVSPISISR